MSLGKDLASIREQQNLTLEDVQKAIKIPVSTLKSIENDSILRDDQENKTYRRSFIRSYAKLLKLDDENVVRALDAMEEGTYHSGILTGEDIEEDSGLPVSDYHTDTDSDDEKAPELTPPVSKAQAHGDPKPNDPPAVNTINWADMGKKFTTASKGSKAWIALVGVILFVLIAGGVYLFSDQIAGLFGTSPSDQLAMESNQPGEAVIDTINQQPTVTAEPDQTEQEEVIPFNEPAMLELGDTLTIAVYAAYGQLEPVRVTSDLNWRTNPFWMEEGEAYYFDFQDSILVRGQYSRMLLLFNGIPLNNPRQNYYSPEYNSILITRDILDNPEYLAPPPEEFPLEIGAPDSIVYRLRL